MRKVQNQLAVTGSNKNNKIKSEHGKKVIFLFF